MGNQFIKFLFCFLLCVLSYVSYANAKVPVNLTISQVDVFLPEITIYANLLDKDGVPVQPVPSFDHIKTKLDGHSLPVKKIIPFKETGEGVTYTILLDVSKTMKGSPFQHAIFAIKKLISKIRPEDRIAIITFGDDVSIVCDFSSNKNILFSSLENLRPDNNNTHFYAAIDQAFAINKRRGTHLPIRKAILIITDGKDEGSGLTIDDLLRKNKKNIIPIYSIGYTKINPIHLDNLKRLSLLSGGSYIKTIDTQDFVNIYQKTIGDILSQFVIKTNCSSGISDGLNHQLILFYEDSNFSITAEKNVWFLYANDMIDKKEADLLPNPNIKFYVICGSSILVIIIAMILFIYFRKKNSLQKETESSISDSFDQTLFEKKIEEDYTSEPAPCVEPEEPEEPEEDIGLIKLVVIKGKDIGKNFEVSIGKNGKNIGGNNSDINIIDTDIDDPHCEILYVNNRFMIEDVKSLNDTFVNGIPIKSRTILENGDKIQIGQSTLRIKF